jgi:uncharacterized membrane protein
MEGTLENIRRSTKSIKYLPVPVVLMLLLIWLNHTPPGLLGKADAIGYAVCHRIELRSFHLGDRQVPLCARCTGMYLGALLGLGYQAFTARWRTGTPPRRVIAAGGALVLFFGVDGLNSYLHFFPGIPTLYEPHNELRLLSGTGMGIVIAMALYPAYIQTVWRRWEPEPAIAGLRSFFWLLLGALCLSGLVLTENPLILYPLALLSAAGVLILLTLIYTMVWLMVFRHESQIERIAELVLPSMGGFALALAQIAFMDLIRFWFSGSWSGFHFG